MTTTPQAALLSDELWTIINSFDCVNHGVIDQMVSAILAKLQATQEPVQAMCEACGSHATHEVGPERTSFPGAYCDDCDPPTAQAEPVQAGELPDERAAFEQWASDNGEFPRAVARSGDVYHLMATQTYWLAWQARAVLSARKPFTNAQIERLFYNSNRGNGCASLAAFVRVVRLVESAHGIGLEVKP